MWTIKPKDKEASKKRLILPECSLNRLYAFLDQIQTVNLRSGKILYLISSFLAWLSQKIIVSSKSFRIKSRNAALICRSSVLKEAEVKEMGILIIIGHCKWYVF